MPSRSGGITEMRGGGGLPEPTEYLVKRAVGRGPWGRGLATCLVCKLRTGISLSLFSGFFKFIYLLGEKG